MKLMIQAACFLCAIKFLKGERYCSQNKTAIECQPCSDICENKTETCKNNNLFACPLNCDREVKCNYVCCEYCRDDKCVYTDGGQVMCTEGCFPGTTGLCCREPCPPGCRECDQFNSSCVSCYDGLSGDYCNEAITIGTTSLCPSGSVSCDGIDSICCSANLSLPVDAHITPLVACVVSVVCLIICVLGCYKITKIYQLDLICRKRITRSNSNQNSQRSLSTEHGYNYIDENDLDSYYSSLKRQTRDRCFQSNDPYHRIAQKGSAKDNIKTNSFHSSSSGSLFGNLFDTSLDSEGAELNISKDDDSLREIVHVSMNEYEKYITPTSP